MVGKVVEEDAVGLRHPISIYTVYGQGCLGMAGEYIETIERSEMERRYILASRNASLAFFGYARDGEKICLSRRAEDSTIEFQAQTANKSL